ncbi:MAG: hypothetical protein JWN48_5488 [Myxococcaceae bacterium]|nr:hypothetical protein [Myxococcaceae bacterium]
MLVLLLGSVGCRAAAPHSATRTARQPTQSSTLSDGPRRAARPAQSDAGPPTKRLASTVKTASDAAIDLDQAFLVETDDGKLLVRTRAAHDARMLAQNVDAVLHQPALELVWFRQGEQLAVIDLRQLTAAPVIVASGMPEVSRLSIAHPAETSRTNDGCDLPYVALRWAEPPELEALLDDAPALQIVNFPWLLEQRTRAVRDVPEPHPLGPPRVRLPAKVASCEERTSCGMTAPFGAQGLQLVQVLEEMGGDCWMRGCLFRDPVHSRFATPPMGTTWGAADATTAGPCGPYLFDRAQTAFLVGRKLCKVEGECIELDGDGVGWLRPGSVVGLGGTSPE